MLTIVIIMIIVRSKEREREVTKMRKITKKAVRAFILGRHFARDNTVVRIKKGPGHVWIHELILHGHTIAKAKKVSAEGPKPLDRYDDIWLSDAGWQTQTTKERLNGLLRLLYEHGLTDRDIKIRQVKRTWYVRIDRLWVPWEEWSKAIRNEWPAIWVLPYIVPIYLHINKTGVQEWLVPGQGGNWRFVSVDMDGLSIPIRGASPLRCYQTRSEADAIRYAYAHGIPEQPNPEKHTLEIVEIW